MKKVVFDEQVAQRYDDDSVSVYHPDVLDPTVDFLKSLASDGAALEFGIGTGRIARSICHTTSKATGGAK